MYSLFMGLWSMLFSKVQYQILILGLDDAGKTTFLEQLKHVYAGLAPPEELKIPPTVGLNIGKLDVGSRVRFLFWDLGGQASLRVLWDKYYSESHAVVWIVDSADRNRLGEAAREIERIARDKDLKEAPIIVLANKQDRADALTMDDIALALGLPPGAALAESSGAGAGGSKGSGDGSGSSVGNGVRGSPARSGLAHSTASMNAAFGAATATPIETPYGSPSVPISPASAYSALLLLCCQQ